MKIGIDIRAVGKQRTGDETYILQLVRHLANIDSKNSYFLYTDTKNSREMSKIKEKLNLGSRNFLIVPVLPSSKALWTLWSLPRQVRKDRLDVLHVQYITPIKLSTGAKIITTIHDVSFARHPGLINKSDLFFLKLLIPLSLKHADRIIAVSKFTKKEIIKCFGVDEKKIVAVKNGGADEKFFNRLDHAELSKARKTLGVSGPFIFYVGTLQPRKNVPFLLKGFAELKRRFSNNIKIQELNLVIGGSRSGRNYDKRIDDELAKFPLAVRNKVIFPGFVEENKLPAAYQASKVFCFPSIYEGFGLPVVEAMASGVPVVCSDGSSLEEIAQGAALTYQGNKLDDLVEKLHRVVADDETREKMIENGKRQAKNFSWSRCAKETLHIYESLR